MTGDVIARVEPKSGAHNTIFGPDGDVYLAGLKSPFLTVADASTNTAADRRPVLGVDPASVHDQRKPTPALVNVNERLGFEVGDLKTGKSCRGRRCGLHPGPRQASRLPEPRHRPDAGRATLGVVDGQQGRPFLRRDRDAAEAGRDPQGPRRARLGHIQYRRPARLPFDGRSDRRRHLQDPRHAHRRGRPAGDEREDGPDRLRGWQACPRRQLPGLGHVGAP